MYFNPWASAARLPATLAFWNPLRLMTTTTFELVSPPFLPPLNLAQLAKIMNEEMGPTYIIGIDRITNPAVRLQCETWCRNHSQDITSTGAPLGEINVVEEQVKSNSGMELDPSGLKRLPRQVLTCDMPIQTAVTALACTILFTRRAGADHKTVMLRSMQAWRMGTLLQRHKATISH